MLIGVILLIGFVTSACIAKWTAGFFANWNPFLLIIVYFVLAISGIVISKNSDDPRFSFLGYMLVVAPSGMILSVVLKGVDSSIIIRALMVTVAVIITMTILAYLRPDFFLSLGRVLAASLAIVIVLEIIASIAGWYRPGIWDVVVAGIFSLWIGYDWAKAQQYPLTLDNAIDSCVDLYLDGFNLFLRVLNVMRNDD
jgi:FtsH-binding integral membrane protein